MEIKCIEQRAWDVLRHHFSLLTSEVEAMKEQYCPSPGAR
jgi:hypothetical protein